MAERKLRNFYQMFGLTAKATDGDIEKAYRRLMEKIRVHVNAPILMKEYNLIYEVLKHPVVRKRYDALLAAQKKGQNVVELNWEEVLKDPGFAAVPAGTMMKKKWELEFWKNMSMQQRLAFLGVLVVVFILSFFLFVFPKVRHTLVSFSPDDPLYNRHNGAYFGKVVKHDGTHQFPNGAVADAYLVELSDHDKRWFPANDIRKTFRTKP